MGAYCVGKVHNMLPWQYEIMGAFCVGMIHSMLTWQYQDSESILLRTYATKYFPY